MTEQEFMELLNLYLDHEISARDAVRLEAEVQRSPQRRAVYREYCRMQKACRVLAADFASPVGVGDTSAPEPKVLHFTTAQSQGRGWRLAGVGAAGILAAASVAFLVFFGRGFGGGGAGRPPTGGPLATAPVSDARLIANGGPASAVRGGDTSVGNHATLVSGSLALSMIRSGESGLKVAQDGDQLEWVRKFQLVSMGERNRLEPLRFEPAPRMLRPDLRTLQHTNQAEPAAEMTAFRFLK